MVWSQIVSNENLLRLRLLCSRSFSEQDCRTFFEAIKAKIHNYSELQHFCESFFFAEKVRGSRSPTACVLK